MRNETERASREGRKAATKEVKKDILEHLSDMDKESPGFQVQDFDSQVEGLADPESTGVKQLDNEAGGIAIDIVDMGQELESLLASGAMAQGWRRALMPLSSCLSA